MEKDILTTYKILKSINWDKQYAWMNIFPILGYTPEEESLVHEAEDREMKVLKDAKKEYYSVEVPKIREQLKELKKEFDIKFINEKRIEYLLGEKEKYLEKINNVYLEYLESYKRMESYTIRKSIRDNSLRIIQKKMRGITMEIRIKKNWSSMGNKNQITPEMIDRARNYQIENLIEVNKALFANCPFHAEKTNSFYVKNNFYYCFGCEANGDTIDLLMKRDGKNFVEAIKLLQ